jgi:hypothetical protein
MAQARYAFQPIFPTQAYDLGLNRGERIGGKGKKNA